MIPVKISDVCFSNKPKSHIIYLLFQILIFWFPLLSLIYFSFFVYEGGVKSTNISLANYQAVINSTVITDSLINSLVLAGCVSVLTFTLAATTLYGFLLINGKYKKIWAFVLISLPIIIGILPRMYAFQFSLSGNGLYRVLWEMVGLVDGILYSWVGILLGYVIYLLPFSFLIMFLSYLLIPKHFVEAALDLGASHTLTYFRVICPMIRPGIVISTILPFITVIGDLTVVNVVGGGSIYTFAESTVGFMQINNWGMAAASAVLMLGIVSVLLVALSMLLVSRRQ